MLYSVAAAAIVAAAASAAEAVTAKEQDQYDDDPQIAVAVVVAEHNEYPFSVRKITFRRSTESVRSHVMGLDGPAICVILCWRAA